MTAAAQFSADVAHVHRVAAAARHHLNTVAHDADGKKHGKFLHFHQPVGQVGEISQIMLHGGFSQNYLCVIDCICMR